MGPRESEKEIAATPFGLDYLVSFGISFFLGLAKIIGFYYAVAVVILLAAIVFDVLKVAFAIVKVAVSKRPEGTGFIEAFYYEIGRSESGNVGPMFGLAMLIAGIAFINFSPKVESQEVQALVSGNPIGVTGALMAGLGFVLIYWGIKGIVKKMLLGSVFYEEPEVVKMKTEMMSAFKQGRTMDAINLFKMDIKSLTDQFAEANSLKFDFNREEKELAEISAVFKKAEKYCKEGSIKEADAEINAAKRKYDGLRPRITNKLRAYNRVKETVNSLKRLSKAIEESIKECSRNKLDCSKEEEAYEKLDMNRVLLSSESFWHDDNFKEALAELEKFKGEYDKIKEALSAKIIHYNELLSRKFPCLKCGKNINLANDVCPSCYARPAETIIEIMGELVDKIEANAKRLEDAKWLMNFETEEKELADIDVALDNITKQVEKGDLDRATSLLMSTKASQEALVSEMKKKLEIYDKISDKISAMKKESVSLKASIEQNKRNGVDVKDEESAYLKANENAALEIIEKLCKNRMFSEALSRLDGALAEYGKISSSLSKKIEKYNALSSLLADIEKSYGETASLLNEARARKVDVSIEDRDLRAINIDAMRKFVMALTSDSETKLKDSLESIKKIKRSLSDKVEMFNQLEGMGSALEERVNELRGLISRGVALKLDIKEEHEKFYTIKMDRIKEMLKSCDDIMALKKELDISLDTAQWCIASLSDKLSRVEDAKKWANAIQNAMKDTEMVDIDSLRQIPQEWRSWAVDRYIESHPEDAFAIYQNKLIKTMPAEKKKRYEDVLDGILSSGKVRGCFIVDDRGVVLASAFPEMRDPMPLGAPAAGIADHGRSIAKVAGIGKSSQFVVGSDDFKIVINELGKGLFLLCSVKPKENVAFTSIVISGGMKKLSDAIG